MIVGGTTLKMITFAILASFQVKPDKKIAQTVKLASFPHESTGTLSKPRRRRQRGHGKTKDLIDRTIA